jgi:hypothetical protein
VHIEVSGPIFGGVTKGCFCCYDATTNGSLIPHGNHSDKCVWKRFIFSDPVAFNWAIVVNFFDAVALLLFLSTMPPKKILLILLSLIPPKKLTTDTTKPKNERNHFCYTTKPEKKAK